MTLSEDTRDVTFLLPAVEDPELDMANTACDDTKLIIVRQRELGKENVTEPPPALCRCL